MCGFEPFWDEKSQVPTNEKVIEGDYSFPSPWWDDVSESAKELVSKVEKKISRWFFFSFFNCQIGVKVGGEEGDGRES